MKSVLKSFKTCKYYQRRLPGAMKNINCFVQNAHPYTTIPKDYLKAMTKPNTFLKLNIPLLRDDGTYQMITSYRCHHKTHRLPLKGGMRISPKMNPELIEGLALLKTI